MRRGDSACAGSVTTRRRAARFGRRGGAFGSRSSGVAGAPRRGTRRSPTRSRRARAGGRPARAGATRRAGRAQPPAMPQRPSCARVREEDGGSGEDERLERQLVVAAERVHERGEHRARLRAAGDAEPELRRRAREGQRRVLHSRDEARREDGERRTEPRAGTGCGRARRGAARAPSSPSGAEERADGEERGRSAARARTRRAARAAQHGRHERGRDREVPEREERQREREREPEAGRQRRQRRRERRRDEERGAGIERERVHRPAGDEPGGAQARPSSASGMPAADADVRARRPLRPGARCLRSANACGERLPQLRRRSAGASGSRLERAVDGGEQRASAGRGAASAAAAPRPRSCAPCRAASRPRTGASPRAPPRGGRRAPTRPRPGRRARSRAARARCRRACPARRRPP